MDLLEIISKIWPILVSIIGLIIVLAKLDHRVSSLEEKVKSLFELWNSK